VAATWIAPPTAPAIRTAATLYVGGIGADFTTVATAVAATVAPSSTLVPKVTIPSPIRLIASLVIFIVTLVVNEASSLSLSAA
jgi:hypothetical protein